MDAALNRNIRIAGAIAALAVLALVLAADPAWAGIGGVFAKGKGIIGIIFLIILIPLLPLVVYVVIREGMAVRRTRDDLRGLAAADPVFDWADIERRVRETAAALYRAWPTGDLSGVQEYFTEDYFDSQQAMLERWAGEGKRNVLEQRGPYKIKPLYVQAGDDWQYPAVVVGIKTQVRDFLEDAATGKKIKGKKKWDKDHEQVWTMIHEAGAWRLGEVEEGSMSLAFATEKNDLGGLAAASPSPAARPAPAPAAGKEPGQGDETKTG